MIPYFEFDQILLGPITINVWGLMVAFGIISGVLFSSKLIKKLVLSEDVLIDMTIWVLISAFIFARVFHVVFYNLDFYILHPIEVFKFWRGGMSSLGGFFGAGLALYLFAKARKFGLKDLWPYFDVMSIGLWLGWGIGRIGCFLIHDHKGSLTNFFLAVRFPSGARFDLGLMESLLGFAIFAVFYFLFEKLIKKRWGLITVYSSLAYAVARFFLDFLRARDLFDSDARYLSLTPAQWGMIVVVIGLTVLLFSGRIRQQKISDGRIA